MLMCYFVSCAAFVCRHFPMMQCAFWPLLSQPHGGARFVKRANWHWSSRRCQSLPMLLNPSTIFHDWCWWLRVFSPNPALLTKQTKQNKNNAKQKQTNNKQNSLRDIVLQSFVSRKAGISKLNYKSIYVAWPFSRNEKFWIRKYRHMNQHSLRF